MSTRKRRDKEKAEKPDWFEARRYSAASRKLDAKGWLYQISIRLAIEAYWHEQDVDADIPWVSESSWQEHGSRLWDSVREHGVVPLPKEKSIGSLDPFRLCGQHVHDAEYAPIRTLATFEVYDALEQLCDYGILWDVDENGKEYLVSGSYEDVGDPDEDGEDFIERRGLARHLYNAFPGDDLCTIYVGVDLNVGDKELIANFQNWLESARKNFGYTKKAKSMLGPGRFGTWSQYRILGYLDLTFWANTQGFAYQQDQLAHLLFPESKAPDNQTVRKTVIENAKFLKRNYWSLRALAEADLKPA